MSYSTGSYTGLNDALDQWRAFLASEGYTINSFIDDSSKYEGDTFTGKRLHVSKTINGTVCYFNFRSCSNQKVFSCSPYAIVTGICCNGSTGYDAGLAWDKQPGFTPYIYGATASGGGNVDKLITSGGTYYFFATPTSATAVFSTNSSFLDWRMMTIGATDLGVMVYACSGGSRVYTSSSYDDRSSFFKCNGLNYSSCGAYALGSWFPSGVQGKTNSLNNVIHDDSNYLAGSTVQPYIAYSPEPIRGNAPLAACDLKITKSVSDRFYGVGVLDGVYFLNMKNYVNGAEITIGANTYKCFKVFNYLNGGVAFRK